MPVKISTKIVSQKVDEPGKKSKPQALAKRPQVLEGSTYKRRYPNSDAALYITINDITETRDGKEVKRPREILLNSKDMKHYQWTVCLTRVMSAVMRQGGDCSFLAEELKNVFDPGSGGFHMGDRFVPSVVADIGNTIEEHLIATGNLEVPTVLLSEEKQAIKDSGIPSSAEICPKCNIKALVKIDGCATCLNCGDSKCG